MVFFHEEAPIIDLQLVWEVTLVSDTSLLKLLVRQLLYTCVYTLRVSPTMSIFFNSWLGIYVVFFCFTRRFVNRQGGYQLWADRNDFHFNQVYRLNAPVVIRLFLKRGMNNFFTTVKLTREHDSPVQMWRVMDRGIFNFATHALRISTMLCCQIGSSQLQLSILAQVRFQSASVSRTLSIKVVCEDLKPIATDILYFLFLNCCTSTVPGHVTMALYGSSGFSYHSYFARIWAAFQIVSNLCQISVR